MGFESCSISDDYDDETDSYEMNEDEREDGSEDESDLASRVHIYASGLVPARDA